MLLLATDTSGTHGSIALASCGPGDDAKIVDLVPLTAGAFSAQLVPEIALLLAKHHFTKHHLEAFAVASGPGSFTGLRVGLAAIKALAEVLEKPIAAVSLLEAVAWGSRTPGKILVALDAGRKEVYVGEFASAGRQPRAISQSLLSREQGFAAAAHLTLVTPDRELVEAALAQGVRVEEVRRPRSDVIASLGWQKIQSGETVSPQELEANYIRRPEAEIFAKNRRP
ncbi:MAG TPA: tRNA (adenosine(37)-N6)-threonylcarbamoyltransferase complex dimerization subunit type 1 TsaB [Terriglobales bacterium]|nr:tRNA (adenosine(37)-N6)-threonylcarbamoyltransferase complex dimerization subunit type 1 TsaB [Terriglobales bacterium]